MSTKKAVTATAKGKTAGANIKDTPATLTTVEELGKAGEQEPVFTDKQKAAKEIAEKMNVNTIYENEMGEYFTVHNLALLSSKNDPQKLITYHF